MKTLHLTIIIISLILIGASNFSMAHVEIPQISTSKSNFTDGDTIPIGGYALPNSTINIFLVNNHGNIQNLTQAKSNSTGYFNTSLGIPSHVIGGAWALFATNGESNFAMQLMVNFHGSNTPPFNFPSGLPPLKQFKLGIKSSYVQCRSDLQLIIKSEDGSPACVISNTAQKLMERGWIKNPIGVSGLAKPPIGIYNLTLSTNPIILGIPFYINAVIVNHQTEPITYYSGCTSPLSVSFDSIKTSSDNIHCLAISRYTLEPNQSVSVQSDKIETLYNATRPNTTTNAQIKFSYEADGKPTSMFTSMQIPIQTAIMIDCSTNVLLHVSQIDKTVNVTKATALAYTSPEFVAKVKQYGNVSYNYLQNDWFSSASCHTYWNGTEVMFTTNDKNGSRNIQVSEDINLTKILKVKDFQVGFSK